MRFFNFKAIQARDFDIKDFIYFDIKYWTKECQTKVLNYFGNDKIFVRRMI